MPQTYAVCFPLPFRTWIDAISTRLNDDRVRFLIQRVDGAAADDEPFGRAEPELPAVDQADFKGLERLRLNQRVDLLLTHDAIVARWRPDFQRMNWLDW